MTPQAWYLLILCILEFGVILMLCRLRKMPPSRGDFVKFFRKDKGTLCVGEVVDVRDEYVIVNTEDGRLNIPRTDVIAVGGVS